MIDHEEREIRTAAAYARHDAPPYLDYDAPAHREVGELLAESNALHDAGIEHEIDWTTFKCVVGKSANGTA